MTVAECKTLAEDSVILFACVLDELDKLDPDLYNSMTRLDVALKLTCVTLGAVK